MLTAPDFRQTTNNKLLQQPVHQKMSVMEDEEFFHCMLDDLERLERVHHHAEFPPIYRYNARTFGDEHTHNPLLSGVVSALSGAVKTTIEALAAKVSERRKLPVASDR